MVLFVRSSGTGALGQRFVEELAGSLDVVVSYSRVEEGIDFIRSEGISIAGGDASVLIDEWSEKSVDMTRRGTVLDFVQTEPVEDICESPVLFTIEKIVDDRAWVRLNQPSGRPPRRLSQGQSRSK